MVAGQHEIADFHPETGHLHTCTDPCTCECAAWLYCLAQDAGVAYPSTHEGTLEELG